MINSCQTQNQTHRQVDAGLANLNNGYGKDTPYPVLTQQLYDKGFEPIPIAPRQKYPTLKGWQSVSLPIEPWPKDHGIGLRTGKLTGIDIDIYDESLVELIVDEFRTVYPEIITRIGQPPKVLIPANIPNLSKKVTTSKWVDAEGVINQIELLSYGQQFVAYGIHPDTNEPYKWDGELLNSSLPVVSFDFLKQLKVLFEMECKSRGWTDLSKRELTAEKQTSTRRPRDTGTMPGDIYNRAVPISKVLDHYGWKHYMGQYWTRPGKERGVSASVYEDRILWPFTSSTQLAPDRCYDAFELLCQYEFNGDKSACAKALREAA